jgi:hypothetical protein
MKQAVEEWLDDACAGDDKGIDGTPKMLILGRFQSERFHGFQKRLFCIATMSHGAPKMFILGRFQSERFHGFQKRLFCIARCSFWVAFEVNGSMASKNVYSASQQSHMMVQFGSKLFCLCDFFRFDVETNAKSIEINVKSM